MKTAIKIELIFKLTKKRIMQELVKITEQESNQVVNAREIKENAGNQRIRQMILELKN